MFSPQVEVHMSGEIWSLCGRSSVWVVVSVGMEVWKRI